MIRRPPRSTRSYTLFPYTTLFRSTPASIDALPKGLLADLLTPGLAIEVLASGKKRWRYRRQVDRTDRPRHGDSPIWKMRSFRTNYQGASARDTADRDRKSTRLNSSH